MGCKLYIGIRIVKETSALSALVEGKPVHACTACKPWLPTRIAEALRHWGPQRHAGEGAAAACEASSRAVDRRRRKEEHGTVGRASCELGVMMRNVQ